MSNQNSFKTSNFINVIIYIIVGILMCVFKARLLSWAMTAIGVILVISGIIQLVKNNLNAGIITAALGVLIIFGGWLFVDIILLILGVLLTVKGILDLLKSIEYKLISSIIASSITMIIGVLLIISKWVLLDWFFIVVGIIFIIDGLLIALGQLRK